MCLEYLYLMKKMDIRKNAYKTGLDVEYVGTVGKRKIPLKQIIPLSITRNEVGRRFKSHQLKASEVDLLDTKDAII